MFCSLDEEPELPSVVASGAVEVCEMIVLVTVSHVLVVVGNGFRAGDPFLCAILVVVVHPLDLPRVVAAREKVDATLVHSHYGGENVPAHLNSISPHSGRRRMIKSLG